MRRVLGRLGGFASTTLLIAFVNLASIPIVTARFGADRWGDLVLGQTVGTLLGVLTAFGWAVTGPAAVAALGPVERVTMYRGSIVARMWLVVPGAVVAGSIAAVLAVHDPLDAAMSAVAVVIGTAGGTWYFIGTGDAKRLLLVDTVPRVLCSLAGAVLGAVSGLLWLVPLLQIAGSLMAVTASTRIVRGTSFGPWGPTAALAAMRPQSSGIVAALLSNVYLALPLLCVSHLAPRELGAFAMADRLLRYGVLASAPLAGLAQSWVPAGPRPELMRRVRVAVRCAAAAGLLAVGAFALAAPWTAGLLSAATTRLPVELTVTYAVAAGAIIATQILGPAVLVALGASRVLAHSTGVGLVVALVLIPAGCAAFGARGAGAGLAVSELVVLGYQVIRVAERSRPMRLSVTGLVSG